MNADGIEIRECHALDEMRACVALQKEVWNFSDAELVPLRLFVVAEKVGGQVMGAYAGDQLIGFALVIPGYRNHHAYLHSHMVGVRADYRNAGLGTRIKLLQRESAMERGFELIEWTYDPLEIKNAYLNIEKLGAISRRYNVNQYGITSSPLQGGLPSDRLIAEWWLKSKRVEAAVAGQKRSLLQASIQITVPREIYQWKASPEPRELAKAVQDKNREEFLTAFGQGLAVVGFEKDEQGNGVFLLSEWESEYSGSARSL